MLIQMPKYVRLFQLSAQTYAKQFYKIGPWFVCCCFQHLFESDFVGLSKQSFASSSLDKLKHNLGLSERKYSAPNHSSLSCIAYVLQILLSGLYYIVCVSKAYSIVYIVQAFDTQTIFYFIYFDLKKFLIGKRFKNMHRT